jgi:hypothetical protein
MGRRVLRHTKLSQTTVAWRCGWPRSARCNCLAGFPLPGRGKPYVRLGRSTRRSTEAQCNAAYMGLAPDKGTALSACTAGGSHRAQPSEPPESPPPHGSSAGDRARGQERARRRWRRQRPRATGTALATITRVEGSSMLGRVTEVDATDQLARPGRCEALLDPPKADCRAEWESSPGGSPSPTRETPLVSPTAPHRCPASGT